jgi:hypothetical protein
MFSEIWENAAYFERKKEKKKRDNHFIPDRPTSVAIAVRGEEKFPVST